MAHIFPGATWRPMPGQEKRPKRRKGRGVGFHIAVSERASIYDINLGTGNDAHLYVRRDGTAEQNIDLDLQAWAGGAGNASMIWVETQGGTTAADVKSGRWTPQQAETLAQISAYAHRTEGTPLDLMPDSRPPSRGLATHRLGIKHSRGIGAVPGFLVAGGELWSSAVGKECPGDARVGQMAGISARAKQIASGRPAATLQEDDMPLTDDDIDRIWRHPQPENRGIPIVELNVMRDMLRNIQALLVDPIPSAVPGAGVSLKPRDMLAAVDANAWTVAQQMAALTGSLNAIAAALAKGSTGGGFTVDEAVAAGRAGAEAALGELGDKLRTA